MGQVHLSLNSLTTAARTPSRQPPFPLVPATETKNRVRDRNNDVTAGTWEVAAGDRGNTSCASSHVLLLSQPQRLHRLRDAAENGRHKTLP